jgi:DNA-binding MarR family transcriptional regulator
MAHSAYDALVVEKSSTLLKEVILLPNNELVKGGEELHPILTSMSLAFWRMRLIVERRAETLPLKLLLLSTASKEEGVSPGEIRHRFGLDFSRISRLIQSLERDGLLRRERDLEDRRFLRLHLTEKGREYLRERTVLLNKEFNERLEALSPAELEELERMLLIVAEGMRS